MGVGTLSESVCFYCCPEFFPSELTLFWGPYHVFAEVLSVFCIFVQTFLDTISDYFRVRFTHFLLILVPIWGGNPLQAQFCRQRGGRETLWRPRVDF